MILNMSYNLLKGYHQKISDIIYGVQQSSHKDQVKLKQLLTKLDESKELITDLMADKLHTYGL